MDSIEYVIILWYRKYRIDRYNNNVADLFIDHYISLKIHIICWWELRSVIICRRHYNIMPWHIANSLAGSKFPHVVEIYMHNLVLFHTRWIYKSNVIPLPTYLLCRHKHIVYIYKINYDRKEVSRRIWNTAHDIVIIPIHNIIIYTLYTARHTNWIIILLRAHRSCTYRFAV